MAYKENTLRYRKYPQKDNTNFPASALLPAYASTQKGDKLLGYSKSYTIG